MISKYYLFSRLSFHSLDGGLKSTKGLNFDKVQVVYFFLITWAFGVVPKKYLFNPGSLRLSPVFYSKSVRGYVPTLRYTIHFWDNYCVSVRFPT